MKKVHPVVFLSLLAATTLFLHHAPLRVLASLRETFQDATKGERTDSQLIERVLIRGNRRIPASTIRSWINARKGDPYSPELLDHDVRSLYNTGHFDDVRVYVEGGLRGGKIITFEVTERPLILEIVCEGIDQATEAMVLEEWSKQKVELSKGSEYDPVIVRRAAAIIRDILVRQRNQQAKVNPMVGRRTATVVSVVFKVEQ